jgi:hypothetical protein
VIDLNWSSFGNYSSLILFQYHHNFVEASQSKLICKNLFKMIFQEISTEAPTLPHNGVNKSIGKFKQFVGAAMI